MTEAKKAGPQTARRYAVTKAYGLLDRWLEKRDEKRFGPLAQRAAEVQAHLEQMPGGAALLAENNRIGAPIRVEHMRNLRGDFGYVSKKPEDGVVSTTLANTGNPVAMARTAYHELRHVLQLESLGLAETGGGRRLREVRTGFMISKMMEADAFTAEALAALQAGRAGKKEFIEELLESRDNQGPNIAHVRAFLKKRPFDSFENDAQFARALFTDLMLNSLDNYAVTFFGNYRMQFIFANTLEQFREAADKAAPITNMTPANILSDIYGPDFMSGTSLAAVTAMFRAALPEEERRALRLIDSALEKRHTFTEEEYRARRREILDTTEPIHMREYLNIHPPGTAYGVTAKFLQAAAEACRPPSAADYRAAVKQAAKTPRPRW